MQFNVAEILQITGGKLLINNNYDGNYTISTDTRTISAENLYLPLSGENFDGHNFIQPALDKGVKGYFTDKRHNIKADKADFAILVDDCLIAYLTLARQCRRRINPKIIAVTGSSGKTSVKEMIYSVLSVKYNTHKSLLNHNNEIGLCQTLMSMPIDTQFLVIEMGMRGKGEISLLSMYSEPDIAVITNVGTAHIGRLGSRENIAAAKCEIADYLNPDGVLIAHNDDLIKNSLSYPIKTIFYDKADKIISANDMGSEFIYKENIYKINVSGDYNITNALSAIETGLLCGMNTEEINSGLDLYHPVGNRWELIELSGNIKIINDSYNANPDSVKASVEAFIDTYACYNKIIVFGNMGELGEYEQELHRQTGKFFNEKVFQELITVGNLAALSADEIKNNKIKKNSFDKNQDVVKYLINSIKPDTAILLKASRCMKFEEIADSLVEINNLKERVM